MVLYSEIVDYVPPVSLCTRKLGTKIAANLHMKNDIQSSVELEDLAR